MVKCNNCSYQQSFILDVGMMYYDLRVVFSNIKSPKGKLCFSAQFFYFLIMRFNTWIESRGVTNEVRNEVERL